MQERAMLEGTALFDTYIESERGIRNEDPSVFLCGFTEKAVEDVGGGEVEDLFAGGGGGGVGVAVGFFGVGGRRRGGG